jgi:hypothetical protein
MSQLQQILVFCLFAFVGIAQDAAAASMAGKVTGPNEELVANVPIEITHALTHEVNRTLSSENGAYSFPGLSAGSYALSITMPCCAYDNLSVDAIEMAADQELSFNIHLQQGGSLNTLGDDPATIANIVRERQVIPDLPLPRLANGKSDLSGVWLVNSDPFPKDPEPLPWAAKVFEERMQNGQRDHPHNRCLPGQPPIPAGGSPFIGKFVQTPTLLVILLEDVPGFRQVFTDGRTHAEDPNPSWMGHSIGEWDGDTLVVDTTGFNDRGWTDGYPRTESMRMTERYRRDEYGRMTATVTIEDAEVFAASISQNMSFDLAPQEEIMEYVCENNKWAPES